MYISKYSNVKRVSDAQYITEIICEHKARREKRDLHYRFWLSNYWEKFYRSQIASANKLLKKYSAKAIVSALNNAKTKNTYSLRSPFLIQIIEAEEKIIASQNTKLSEPIDRKKSGRFRKNQKKNNILSTLKEIEDEHQDRY